MAPPTSSRAADDLETHSMDRPTRPVLTIVLDLRQLPTAGGAALNLLIAELVRAGVDGFQVRERGLSDLALLEYARDVTLAARRAGRGDGSAPRILINRRADVALAVDADGVHLGFDALPSSAILELERRAPQPLAARSPLQIGCSTHACEEVADAAARAVDYVHLAPIFEPLSKPATRGPLGLAVLARATRLGVPVLAQGGIDDASAARVVAAGAAGVAVTGHVLGADDPARAARALRDALDSAVSPHPHPPGC